MKFKLQIVLFYQLLYLSVCFTLTYGLGYCAVLYENENYEGKKLSLEDGNFFANLQSEYISTESVWNLTKSWSLNDGCLLTACNESYFGGFCQEFTTNTSTLTSIPVLNLGVESVNCTCANDCQCSDVLMKSTSCARAYLTTSCNTCNPTYTDLTGEKKYFSFEAPIKSLMVRPGCTLTIYDEEDFSGDQTIYESNVEEYAEDGIGSYECQCQGANDVVPPVKVKRPDLPIALDIPSTLENITTLMSGELENHPGLRAALQSVKNKRSPNHAYILLLGSTGSGKSTAINFLFDNPNVTNVGDSTSTTHQIHEFRIPVQSDELGILNGELRVIDTPGLGDTKGLDQDAKFLATLDEFLANHEELKDPNRIPNIVLIVHKFTDNRYRGTGSNYVKVLRGLDSLRTRITDKNYSNVIFLFTHFASETKELVRRPTAKLASLKEVIEDYSLFPKPIMMVVGENKPSSQELPLVNGYVKLPNGEYYPKNLFDKIQTLTAGGGDAIGGAIITAAFRDSTHFNISRVTTDLVNSGNAKVAKYFDILTGAVYDVESTEISTLIAEAYDKMSSDLLKRFPQSKYYLQKAMNLRNVRTKEDIPKTTLEIIMLLTSLKLNEANLFLLENGLGLKPPTMKENILTGHSYNVFKDIPLTISPLEMGNPRSSEIAFSFPSAVSCSIVRRNAEVFKIFENQEDYLSHRLETLNVQGKIPLSEFKGHSRPGFNIKGIHIVSDGNTTVTAVREFRNFELILNDRLNLSPKFKNSLLSLGIFNESSHESVETWKSFFNEYGTHIIKSAWGGGSIEIELTSSKPFGDGIGDALYDFVQFAENVNIGKSNNKTLSREGVQHALRFRGGDQAYHTTDLTKLKLSAAATLLENWKESLDYNPTILTSEFRLLPISEVAKRIGQNISSEIQRATALLFNASLIWIKPQKPEHDITTRDHVQFANNDPNTNPVLLMLKQMAEDSKKSEERFHTLIAELNAKAAENEAKKEVYRQEQLKWEREQKSLENERKAADEARKTQLDEKRLEIEREIKLAQVKAENENKLFQQEMAERNAKFEEERSKMNLRMIEMMSQRPQPSKGSCLRKGTLITLADGNEKPVEEIQIGDMILDHLFQPTQVISTLEKFLLNDHFYGFSESGNNATGYFFTKTHLIGGTSSEDNFDGTQLQFYVTNIKDLYNKNPLLENYLSVSEINSSTTNVLFLNKQHGSLETKRFGLISDPDSYTPDTMVHILQVDSPHGTYFANGVVCRHELPPLDLWPKTTYLLVQIVNQPEIHELIQRIEYTIENVEKVSQIVESLNSKLGKAIQELLKNLSKGVNDELQGNWENQISNPEETIMKVFSEQMFSVLGMGLYSTTGKMLQNILDNPNYILNEREIQILGNNIINVSVDFLKDHLRSV